MEQDTSRNDPSVVVLNRAELAVLLEQAAARGAALALGNQSPSDLLGNADAAARFYGRPDRIESWRQFRMKHPEIDALSTGTGAARCWTRAAIDSLVEKFPQLRRRAQRTA